MVAVYTGHMMLLYLLEIWGMSTIYVIEMGAKVLVYALRVRKLPTNKLEAPQNNPTGTNADITTKLLPVVLW